MHGLVELIAANRRKTGGGQRADPDGGSSTACRQERSVPDRWRAPSGINPPPVSQGQALPGRDRPSKERSAEIPFEVLDADILGVLGHLT